MNHFISMLGSKNVSFASVLMFLEILILKLGNGAIPVRWDCRPDLEQCGSLPMRHMIWTSGTP